MCRLSRAVMHVVSGDVKASTYRTNIDSRFPAYDVFVHRRSGETVQQGFWTVSGRAVSWPRVFISW